MDNNGHRSKSPTGLRDKSPNSKSPNSESPNSESPNSDNGSSAACCGSTLSDGSQRMRHTNTPLNVPLPDSGVISRHLNYITDQNGTLSVSSPGGASGSQKMKALQPHGHKNYENTLVMPSDDLSVRRDPGLTGAGVAGASIAEAGVAVATQKSLSRSVARPVSSLDFLSDCDNFDPKSLENPNGDSGDFEPNEKRSVTLPRCSSLAASPVVHDNIGRSGVKKIAKLWRFLTKKRPQSQTNLCSNPALMSNSLDSACQTDEDILDGLGVGNRFSIISNSSSFSSAMAPSCFCAGLRLPCGTERRHHARVESGVLSDAHTATESVRARNSVLVRDSEDIELEVTGAVGGQEVGQNSEEKVHLGNSSAPSVLVNSSGTQQRDRGAYRHFCCGVGSAGSATSSIVSLSGETRRDMAPGQVRSAVPDPPAIPSEPDVEQPPQREPTPPPPAIIPRGSGGSTIHTQIDYVHCLVPDLARIASCSYYWGVMDRYEAERLLDGKPEGTFLLRDSAQFDFLFSVSFRRYGRSLHARVEQWNHRFSFDSHDPSVFSSPSVCQLIEHYKDPASCMFFEPLLTAPLPRNFTFSLQSLCRTAICSATTYDGIASLPLPQALRDYLQYYHYKQEVRVRRFEALPVPPVPPTRPLPPLPHGTLRGGTQENRGDLL